MAEQSGERRAAAEVREELINLMLPDVDPELVQLVLSRSAGGRNDHEGHHVRGGTPRTGLLQEYAELLALIRDADIDRVRLRAILGLNPEIQPSGNGNPHPSAQ